MDDKEKSLDETLKEMLEETSAEEKTEETPKSEKPKRTRRTKAQIEADKVAAEASKVESNSVSSSNIVDEPRIETEEEATIPDSKEDSDLSIDNSTQDVKVEEISNPLETTKESEISNPSIEHPKPEILKDDDRDKMPDIESPKHTKSTPKTHVKGEVYDALETSPGKKTDPNSLISKSFVLKTSTPVYRARHTSMRLKPYQGLVIVIENPKSGFVKVQFLRQGFGLCEGFIEERYILNAKG